MKKTPSQVALAVALVSLFSISVPLFAADTDDRIESSIQKSYVFKTYLKGDDINVKSKDGVVTLTGTVSEESHKSLAGETSASVPGTKSLNNNLKIKGETPVANSDAWLITKVKTTLLFHRNVKATATEVLAKDGAVTLRGKADNAAQKELTTEYASDVEGVKTVKNEMTVPTTEMKPESKAVAGKVDATSEVIDDVSVTSLVKMTLLSHRSTSAIKTTVETKDGVVNLGGTAKNAAEKSLATKLVADVEGVQKVVNNMTVVENK